MRLIKDDYELDELRKACAVSKLGFEDVIRAMRTARASARSKRRSGAARASRPTTSATSPSPPRANTPARCTGLATTAQSSAERSCCSTPASNATRSTPPTSRARCRFQGRFSHEQRTVYELVCKAQRAGIEAAVAGNDFLEPNRRAMRVLAEGLVDLGILNVRVEEALDGDKLLHRRYTLHNVSHMLGLDVHDCASAREQEYRYGKLREGMVLTVEPGLYFQPDDVTVPERFRGIGVRIEDDVAVTAQGPENLSAALPSRAGDVEELDRVALA